MVHAARRPDGTGSIERQKPVTRCRVSVPQARLLLQIILSSSVHSCGAQAHLELTKVHDELRGGRGRANLRCRCRHNRPSRPMDSSEPVKLLPPTVAEHEHVGLRPAFSNFPFSKVAEASAENSSTAAQDPVDSTVHVKPSTHTVEEHERVGVWQAHLHEGSRGVREPLLDSCARTSGLTRAHEPVNIHS